MNERHDDLQEIIDAALREMAAEEGDGFDPQACNLAEFCRRTGLTRSRARTVRAHGFRALPHGNSGRRAAPGVLAGHTGLVDDLLRKGVTNSQVIFERLLGQGYAGGLTTVKTYIAAHRDLVPAKRRPRGAAAASASGRRPERPTRWTGASSRSSAPAASGRGSPASPWSATIAGAPTSSSSRTRARRTSSSGCCTRSRRWACPRPCSPTT